MNQTTKNLLILGPLPFLLGMGGWGIDWYFTKNRPPPVELVREVREYEVVGIRPPKHFGVTLLDSTNHELTSLSISKHCNSWRELGMNSKHTFETVITQDYTGRLTKHIIGTARLCPGRN